MPFPTPSSSPSVSRSELPEAPDVPLLRRVTDAAPLLLSYVGADLRYHFLNGTYAEWFGHERETMLGRTVPEVLGPDAWERIRPTVEAVLGGTPVTYEGQMPYASGGHRFVRTSLVPDRDPVTGAVRGFVGVVTDISDRREAELKLEDSEERFRSLFEYSDDAVYGFDLSGNYVLVNRACEAISGYTRADLVQMSFAQLLAPEDLARTTAHFLRAAKGEVQHYETAIRHKDGHRVELSVTSTPMYSRGEIVGVYGIARDITEQKRMARLLAEADAKQRRFVREMLFSLTEGRLCLCESRDDLPLPLDLVAEPIALTRPSLRTLRRIVTAAADDCHILLDRAQDFITAIGEASMNAVVHAGGGLAEVRDDEEAGCLQVWVQDNGTGIKEDALHRATLEKGFSSAGTLGHGFWMMPKTADRVYLLTGPQGTTVVLEQERHAPDPHWLRQK